MKKLLLLKIIVGAMTITLFIGAGFIFYGLVREENFNQNTKSNKFSLPENATLISYQTNGEYITFIYSCNKDILFKTINTKGYKTSTIVAKGIASPPYNNCKHKPTTR